MSRVQLDAPRPTPLIQVEGVHKRFATRGGDVVALEGVSLDVAEREFISLLGPSGCGKSTLVRLLAQLDRPTEAASASTCRTSTAQRCRWRSRTTASSPGDRKSTRLNSSH